MGTITSISDLYTELSGEVVGQPPDASLTFTTSTVDNANLQQFIQTLPDAQLVLNGVTLIEQVAAFPQTLTISGSVAYSWPIAGIYSGGISSVIVTIIFTQTEAGAAIDASLSATGNLQIQGQNLPIAGTLQPDASLLFALQSPGATSLGLSAIADYASNGRMNDYLPAGIALFDLIPVSALSLSCGFATLCPTAFSVTSDTGSFWTIVPATTLTSAVTIEHVGVTVTGNYWMQTVAVFQSSFGGNIHGTITLGADFTVVLFFRPGNVWELAILPAEGNLMPALDALTSLIGGAAFQQAVDAGLAAIGIDGIAIVGVHIGFDYVSPALSYIRIEGSIDYLGATINVYVSASNFYQQNGLPSFTFGGALAEGSEISLSYLADYYFGTTNFPAISVVSFTMSAAPVDSAYQLSMGLEDRQFHIGPVYLNQFIFHISYNRGTVAGGITAAIHIGDGDQEDQDYGIDVMVSASSDDILSGGWLFEGKTAEGQIIPIGDFLIYLSSLFGITLPTYFDQITLQDILIQFNTGTGDFKFDITGNFPLAGNPATMNVGIAITNRAGVYQKSLSGQLLIGTAAFALNFSMDDTATSFAATYADNQNPLTVEEIFAAAGFDVEQTIPQSLNLAFTSASFIYDTRTKALALSGSAINLFTLPGQDPTNNFGTAIFITDQPAATRRYIFGVNVNLEINLSNLPVIGQEFSSEQTLAIKNLQVLIASTDLSAQDATTINSEIAPSHFSLPTSGVSAGISFSGDMSMGGTTTSVTTAVVATPIPSPPPTDPVLPAVPDSTRWVTLQKSFGPVTFKRVGVLYQNEQVFFKLDASLAFAGLGLSLDGLSVSSPLTNFAPSFHLAGLGMSFVEGPLDIAGAFLAVQLDPSQYPPTGDYYEYDGGVTVMFEGFGFAAVGSYAKLGSFASMFVFGEIDAPLGGLPSFFITGLSGGFGYNSRLRIPDLNEVYRFPFVAGLSNPDLLGGQNGKPPTPLDVLDVLERGTNPWVRAKAGEDWLAVGISFTGYELVNSRALLVAEFGQTFEFALMGLATMQLPKGLPEDSPEVFGYVELQLEAVFVPADGFIGISAVLSPNSYLLDKSCHPTGGFALYMWLAGTHAGDFALSIGGYHPSFTKPAHYPTVPRVGFNWPVSKQITIKGEAYCALTPAMIMAGGLLDANYQDGDLKAWFTAKADFLIGYQPFYYQASIGVSVGASYKVNALGISKTFSAEIGATLDLWGPPTGGTVTVDWYIISFTVNFGASKNIQATPLTWSQFAQDEQKLLPDATSVLTLSAQDGLLLIDKGESQPSENAAWVVRPSRFSFITNSAIPASLLQVENAHANWTAPPATSGINIRPMSKTPVVSTIQLEIKQNNSPVDLTGWTVEARLANVPAALWGTTTAAVTNVKSAFAALAQQTAKNPNEAPTIANQAVGFKVTGKSASSTGSTAPIAIANLDSEPVGSSQALPLSPGAQPASSATPTQETDMIAQIMQTVNAPDVAQTRTAIFNALHSLYGQIGDSQAFPNTNGGLPNLASEAGGIYTDAPLAPPARAT
jgi:uncharacterized protein DUF6603